jgi:hypothetical protein
MNADEIQKMQTVQQEPNQYLQMQQKMKEIEDWATVLTIFIVLFMIAGVSGMRRG